MTLGYTEIEYGTVKILNCQTLKFHQEEVKDSSGIDTVFTRFTVRVSGYLLAQTVANTQITPNLGATGQGSYVQTAGSQNVGLRDKMLAPRQQFKMTLGVGGGTPTVILQAKPFTSAAELLSKEFDCQGGPVPVSVDIIHIAGNTAIKVEWECVVCIVPDCHLTPGTGVDPQKSRGILSNKWSCADDVDENFYIRSRTFVGELKLANPLINPHEFRTIVVPAIQPGMRLKGMQFKASEDGLSLQYTVTHEEVTVTAPYPATSIRISHRVHVKENQVEVNETLGITLKGDRDVNKQELITLASYIADGKLRLKELIPPVGIDVRRPVRMISYEVLDESGTDQENKIHVVYHICHLPSQRERVVGMAAVTRISGRIGRKIDGFMLPSYSNTKTRGNRPNEVPETSGPIPVVSAFCSHLQGLCVQDHSAVRGVKADQLPPSEMANSKGSPQNLPDVSLVIFSELEDLPDSTFNSSHAEAIYQSYEIDSEYQEDPLIFQAPVGTSVSLGTILNQTQTETTEPTSTTSTNPQPTSSAGGSSSSAAAGDTSVFIRLGPSQWRRVVRICAKRHGRPPRLPNPQQSFRDEDGVLNVLLKQVNLGCEPQRSPDGESKDYILRTEYHYGLSKAPQTMKFGVPDYDAPVSLGVSLAGNGPYSFSRAVIFSSDHAIG
jgi:hypothetical protein